MRRKRCRLRVRGRWTSERTGSLRELAMTVLRGRELGRGNGGRLLVAPTTRFRFTGRQVVFAQAGKSPLQRGRLTLVGNYWENAVHDANVPAALPAMPLAPMLSDSKTMLQICCKCTGKRRFLEVNGGKTREIVTSGAIAQTQRKALETQGFQGLWVVETRGLEPRTSRV